MSLNEKFIVEVWSDIVCPFCYIGKRNYEKAVTQFKNADSIILEYKSFQLDPDFVQDPDKKYNLNQGLAMKYGRSIREIETMQQRIIQTAKEAGLEYHLDQAITFNTFRAHCIIQKANEKGLGEAMEEALFAAYFTQGKDLGNIEILQQVALSAGLGKMEIEEALHNDEYANKVRQDIREATHLGISGVPFFIFNRKYGVSGAQPPEVFLETLTASFDEWQQSATPTLKASGTDRASCDVSGNCD